MRSACMMVCSRCATTSVVRPWHRRCDRILHQPLGFGIERRGRLVEQDDRRVLDQRARDRDALALPARELQPVLADRRVVAGGKP